MQFTLVSSVDFKLHIEISQFILKPCNKSIRKLAPHGFTECNTDTHPAHST